MLVVRRTSRSSKSLPLFGALALIVACSSSEDIDFFEPGGGSTTTGGSSGSDTGGMSNGGSSSGSSGTDTGGTSAGGTSGDSSGGTGADPAGGTAGDTGGTGGDTGGDTGGSGTQGGTGGTGKGGTGTTGGDAGKGGASGSPSGGASGAPLGGAGMGGAGTGGAGAGGAGMGGAGTGGAGAGGAGAGGAGAGGVSGAAGKGGKGGSTGCIPTVPSTERCDGVDNNCMSGVDEGTTCPDGCTGATRAGHAYMLCSWEKLTSGTRNRSWVQASDFCTQRSSALVAIESAEENQFVLDWITRLALTDSVWMGANDRDTITPGGREGTWVWGSGNNAVQFWDGDEKGSPVMSRYNDWDDGEPNNMSNEDCAVWADDRDYHWADRVCTDTHQNLVCETTAAAATN